MTFFETYLNTDLLQEQSIDKIQLSAYYYPEPSKEQKIKHQKLLVTLHDVERQIDNNPQKPNYDFAYQLDYEKALNPMQYKAATAIQGAVLLLAGAGSGKTRTIIYRVAYILENFQHLKQGGINIAEKILLLTFTNKAAKEMVDRVKDLLKDTDIDASKVQKGTFHAFSYYLLNKYCKVLGLTPNMTILDQTDSQDVLKLLVNELDLQGIKGDFPRKKQLLSIISKSRNTHTSIEQVIKNDYEKYSSYIPKIITLSKLYEQYKNQKNQFDYDDLMEKLLHFLKNNKKFRESIQKNYWYIMVDEYQDTNKTQKEILDLIVDPNDVNIMVVGDDAQSIYKFRGANIDNILTFTKTHKNTKVIKLNTNYRSTKGIVNYTNAIANSAKIGYKKSLEAPNKDKSKPKVICYDDTTEEAIEISQSIKNLIEQGTKLSNIAVLYRNTFLKEDLETELIMQNIPYKVVGGIRFSDRKHIKDILAHLRVAINPFDMVNFNRILHLIKGVGKISAMKIIEAISQNKGNISFDKFSNKKYYPELKELEQIMLMLNNENILFAEKVNKLVAYYLPILETQCNDMDKRVKDIDRVKKLIKEVEYTKIEGFLTDFTLEPPNDETTHKGDMLTLSTIHSSKGLEWQHVFIISLMECILPSEKALGNIDEIEEERRLFYVACSRAKTKLTLSYVKYFSKYGKSLTMPSRFLIEPNKALFDF